MKDKKIPSRLRSLDRQEKDKNSWKKPSNIKPVKNTRVMRKSGAR